AQDGALRRLHAESRRRTENRVRCGFLPRHGIAPEDEREEWEETGDPEGLDGRVMAFVRDGGEPPGGEGRVGLPDARVGAHSLVCGLGLDPVKFAYPQDVFCTRESAT